MTKTSLLFLLLASCYDFGTLQSEVCTPWKGCGDGRVCVDGFCELPTTDDGGMMTHSDGGASPDMAQTPADMVDPYAWNPAAKPGPAPGCMGNSGYRLSATLYACVGMFDSTSVSKQCAPGWTMATTLTIPESACASVPWGFFAGAAHGLTNSATIDASARCDWQAPDGSWSYANRLGCGPTGRIWSGAQGNKVYTFAAVNKCGGFPVVARCTGQHWSSADTPWNCDPTSYPYTESQFPQSTALAYQMDGTLCAQQ